MPVRVFSVVVGSSVYFLRDSKYVSAIFFSSHLPAKIYVKSNLLKSGSYCICFLRSQCVTCMRFSQQLAEFWSRYGSYLN